jgi:hypothetical protein
MSDEIFTIDPKKVIYADLDPKEGVVLNLETKNYYRLNETGQIVWRGLSSGKSVRAVSAEISETYDVPSETALADVEEIVSHLKRERLI